MIMGVKSNNNSSTYGTSKTYSGRKTRDCMQANGRALNIRAGMCRWSFSIVGLPQRQNTGLDTVVLRNSGFMRPDTNISIVFLLEDLDHVGPW